MSKYNSKSIKVLEGLEAVRLRPGMYIGSTGSKGLHHLVYEILDNAIDEHLAGFCKNINVKMLRDGSVAISDDGRGMPVDLHDKGLPASRVILTTLHAGGKFDSDAYRVSGGLHGVGASVVNALSKRMDIIIHKDGHIHKDGYKNGGEPNVSLKNGLLPTLGKTDKTGTMVTFLPDDTIFETVVFKPEYIRKRLKELAYLNAGLRLVFENERDGEALETYHYENGLLGLMNEINQEKDRTLNSTLHFKGVKDGVAVEVVIEFIRDFSENIISYCNNINTVEGGTHVSGLKTVFTRIINQYARESGVLKEKDENFDGRDVRNGMVALISMRHPNPQYEGQTKTKLGNADARSIVDEIIATEAQLYFDKNPEVLKSILSLALRSQKIRKAEETLKDNLLNKSMKLAVSGKLAACKTRDPKKAELIIVEGDSAGGSAKQGRDRKFQAILPLKGKVLNVEKQTIGNVLKNTELTTLISTLGCGFGEGLGDDFNIKKLKYDKIIILTDADVDGSHIRTLLLTFFYRYMPELIYSGNIAIGVPPLYKAVHNGKTQYLYDEAEKNLWVKKGASLQRYKGLGEMNPDQLWDTTLDPKRRVIKIVEIDDAVEADKITSTLMGTKVPPRRAFIEREAERSNIDI